MTGPGGRVYVQRAAAAEGSMVVQVGGDLYVSEEGLSALWAAAEAVPGECPYPGLDAFGPSQAKWFFGRELLTGDLLDLLDASLRAGYGGPVVVVGPSGAGKSSLLGAGLLKALRDGRLAAAGSDAWPIVTITPGTTPLATLTATIGTCAAALAGVGAASPPGPADSPDAWESAFAALRTALRTGDTDEALQRVTVVVDQFEELFTADCDDAGRQAFLDALAALAAPGPDGPVGLVVLGMRADFYGRAAEYPVLRTALQSRQLVLGAMAPAEVTQAITRPARATGLGLEGGLTERLMRDLGVGADGIAYEAGRLPLLAYALRATWQRRSGNRLTVAGYEATGGIGGAIAKAAEDAYTGLDASGQRTAQQLFLALVQVGSSELTGEGIPDTRRRLGRERLCSLTSDAATAREVLDLFTVARLITSGGQTVEISHDALLSRWPRLRDWIGQDRSGHLVHQSLEEAAEAWDREGRDSAALYGGIRLAAAHQWADNPGRPRHLSPVARDFLAASGRRRRRGIRRRNGIIAILAALSAGLALLTGYAFTQRAAAVQQGAAAVQQRDQAIYHQVIAEALQYGTSDTSLAAQLILVAYRLWPTQDLTPRLLNTENIPLSRPLPASAGDIQSVAFSLDGHVLADGDDNGTIRLWDVADHAHPRPLGQAMMGGTDAVNSVDFSPDGHTLASGDGDGTIRLWDVADPEHPRPLGQAKTSRANGMGPVDFSPDGHTLASGDGDGTIRLWDVADPEHPRPLSHFQTVGGAESMTFSPDGHTLASSSNNIGSSVRLWDVADPEHPRPLGQPQVDGDSTVLSLAFGRGGHMLVGGDDNGTVWLWDVTDPAHPLPLTQFQTSGRNVSSVTLNPSGRMLAAGNDDGTVQLWDVTDPLHPSPLSQLQTGSIPISSVAFSPDGTMLASGEQGGPIQLWNIPGTVLTGPPIARSVAFTPNGQIVATADDIGTIRLLDVTNPAHPRVLSQPQIRDSVFSVAFSPDGHTMASGDGGGKIRLWDVTHPVHPHPLSRPLTGGSDTVDSVAFSRSGDMLASADADGTILLWDVTDPAHPRPLSQPQASGDSVAFSSRGHMLAVGDDDGTVGLWDVTDPAHPRLFTQIQAQTGGSAVVYSVAFSPDGRTLASGNLGGTVGLWDVTDPAHPRLFTWIQAQTGGSAVVYSVAFSPDGRTLASGDFSGTVGLWNVADPVHPRPLSQNLTGGADIVDWVAFSPDGQMLASADYDGTIRFWSLKVQYAIDRICATAGGLTPRQWNQYIPQLKYKPSCAH